LGRTNAHGVEQEYSDDVVRPDNDLLFLDLHGGFERGAQVARLCPVLVVKSEHGLGAVDAEEDDIPLSLEELEQRATRCLGIQGDGHAQGTHGGVVQLFFLIVYLVPVVVRPHYYCRGGAVD
jgi:hypothetical protein